MERPVIFTIDKAYSQSAFSFSSCLLDQSSLGKLCSGPNVWFNVPTSTRVRQILKLWFLFWVQFQHLLRKDVLLPRLCQMGQKLQTLEQIALEQMSWDTKTFKQGRHYKTRFYKVRAAPILLFLFDCHCHHFVSLEMCTSVEILVKWRSLFPTYFLGILTACFHGMHLSLSCSSPMCVFQTHLWVVQRIMELHFRLFLFLCVCIFSTPIHYAPCHRRNSKAAEHWQVIVCQSKMVFA